MNAMDKDTLSIAGIAVLGMVIGLAWHFLRRPRCNGRIPTINEVARVAIDAFQDINPSRYYVVEVNGDGGIYISYLEKQRLAKVTECMSLDEALHIAKSRSYDPEKEAFACIFAGSKEVLHIFQEGSDIFQNK